MVIIAFISTMIISFLAGALFMEFTYSKKEVKNKREIGFVYELPKKRVAGKPIVYPAHKGGK